MPIDSEDMARVAQAYVEYSVWFVREGGEKFRLHQDKVRQNFAPEFGKIAASIRNGPEAVWTALQAIAPAFQKNLDVLTFEDHSQAWANDRVREMISGGGESAWVLIQEIVARAPDADDVLGFIGAGPFEDWVSEERVQAVQEQFARLLSNSTKFQRVVLSSWDVPPTLQRVLKSLGL